MIVYKHRFNHGGYVPEWPTKICPDAFLDLMVALNKIESVTKLFYSRHHFNLVEYNDLFKNEVQKVFFENDLQAPTSINFLKRDIETTFIFYLFLTYDLTLEYNRAGNGNNKL